MLAVTELSRAPGEQARVTPAEPAPRPDGRLLEVKGPSQHAETTGVGAAGQDEAAREQCARALSALEDHPDGVDAAHDEIAALLSAARASGDEHLLWRARRLAAQVAGQRGDMAAAVEELLKVQHYASTSGHTQLLAQTHHDLSWIYRDIGDLDNYLHHAVQAVEQLDAEAPPGVRAMHLLRLADALDDCGFPAEAVERYAETEEYAVRHGETVRQVRCLNNRAYSEYLTGDVEAAQTTMARLVAVSSEHGVPLHWAMVDTIARIEIALGEYDRAVETSRHALQLYETSGVPEVFGPIEAMLTCALAERLRGRHDAAQAYLDQTRQRATEAGAASLLVKVEEEQSQLHAARRDWEAAYRSLSAFHDAEKALLSEQRATQTTLRLAVLRTQEAWAEADRFRTAALRDALTGLRNRRFVDQALPRLLELGRQGTSVAVALLDLDHFKQVNDTCSHVAGDAVLIAVAGLLDEAVATWQSTVAGGDDLAARLGGEEFIVILVGGPAAEAAQHIDRIRERVAGHDWAPMTGAVPVTVSAGLSWVAPDDTERTLLRRVDDLLYRAKHAGRNAVVHDGSVTTGTGRSVIAADIPTSEGSTTGTDSGPVRRERHRPL